MAKKDMMPMERLPLAQAYIPYQEYECLYPLDEALEKGTIFPSLYRPYKTRKK